MPIYKIKNKQGLFASGSTTPSFTTHGKTWTSKLSLMAHLALYQDGRLGKAYKDCELVEFEMQPVKVIDMNDYAVRRELYQKINKQYRFLEIGSFAEDLLAKNLLSQFRYLIGVQHSPVEEVVEQIKRLNIKKSQYRSRGRCFAFMNADEAALLRLANPTNLISFDLVKLIPFEHNEQNI